MSLNCFAAFSMKGIKPAPTVLSFFFFFLFFFVLLLLLFLGLATFGCSGRGGIWKEN